MALLDLLKRFWLPAISSIVLAVLYSSIKKDVVEEAHRTYTIKSSEISYALEALRSKYDGSGLVAKNWDELRQYISGKLPLRIYKQNSSVAENADLAVYPFTSPACVAFRGESAFHACMIYHVERGRLQIVTSWSEGFWDIPRIGGIDPSKGDRLVVNYGSRTLVISPQLSKTSKLSTCKPISVTRKARSDCQVVRLSAYFLANTGLLGNSIGSARGVAVKTKSCPPGVPSPCVKMVASISELEKRLPDEICLQRLDSNEQGGKNRPVFSTCSSTSPIFGDGYAMFPLKSSMDICRIGMPCICPTADAELESCIAIDSAPNSPLGTGEALPGSSVATFLAKRAVEGLGLNMRRTLALSQKRSVGHVVIAFEDSMLVDAMVPVIERRLVMYGVVVTIFLLALVLIFYLRLQASKRSLTEKQRDSAMSERALIESILRSSTAALNDLGHEVLSPTASIRHIYSNLRDLAKSDTLLSEKLKESHADLLGGYIERIVHAGEKLRAALKLQRRQAEAARSEVSLDLCAYFEQRLSFQEKETGVPHHLNRPPYPVAVLVEEGALESIVGNILANAKRFCMSRPVKVRISATSSIAEVEIRNEGPIIRRGEEERIFEAGVSLSPGREETSSGLGLFLARTTISAMRGTIVAMNDPPPATNGVTFRLTFLLLAPAK